MNESTLENRVKRLEDIEEIKRLKAGYTYYADQWKYKELSDLFSENIKVDFGPLGIYQGKKEVMKFYEETVPGLLSFMMHTLHNPIIDVNGDKATGLWYWHLSGTHRPSQTAVWAAGKYEEEYRREHGRWKFSLMKVPILYFTTFDEGWVKKSIIG